MSFSLFSIGRILIGIYFLLPGIAKVFLFSANLEVVIAKEVPFPVFSLSIVAVAQILLGLFIIFGKHLKVSSIGLAVTTLLINFYINDFFIHIFCSFMIFKIFVSHYVTPMTICITHT